jgi:tRNA (guanine37-N1)-methyltransferase
MRFAVVTLFPEMFRAITCCGITARAIQQGLIGLDYWNPRDFTHDRHRTVDDRPYGGGPGMVMRFEPVAAAIRSARVTMGPGVKVAYLTPQGRPLNQRAVEELARRPALILVAGRYEGVDERLVESEVDEELSIGDYVLSGGELAAMVVVDAVTRLLPGALGHRDSAREDSFFHGLLDYPHYTRPEWVAGRKVPDVLLTGNHADIRRWRLKQALGRTWLRRRDLLESLELDAEQEQLMRELMHELGER